LFDRSAVSSSRPAIATTSRADAVKDGRRSAAASHPAVARPRLDGGEHDVILVDGRDASIQPRFNGCYDFQTPADRPLQFANETTYTGDPTVLSHRSTREWIHSLSAVLGGLIDAGLAITMFHEHEVLPWRGLECLVPARGGLWRLPDGMARIPLSYSVKAKKLRANSRS